MTQANDDATSADYDVDGALHELAEMLDDRIGTFDHQLAEENQDDNTVWAYTQLVETYRRVLKDIDESQSAANGVDEPPVWKEFEDLEGDR